MNKIKYLALIACCSLIFISCKKHRDEPTPEPIIYNTVPAFFKPATEGNYGTTLPDFIVVANKTNALTLPWDLDFNPNRENELWVINKGSESSGGSTVMFTNVGMANQDFDYRKDGNAWHFMSLPSAISFSREYNTWATSADVLDANHKGGDFTGPSLWSTDLSIYAEPSGGNGSHLDMLHGSPYSMGIEADKNNAFWVVDGYNQQIVWYDFANDHGAGNSDHSDGKIHRYSEIYIKRLPGVPSHLVIDKPSGWLYIADAGNKRIIRMNTKTGTKLQDLPPVNEPLAEYWEMEGVQWEIFTDVNLIKPCGIEIIGNNLFVSDNQSGEIIAFDLTTKKELARINTGKAGIMGIKADKAGKLWYVNALSNELIRIDPK
ncbi:MAG: hypothetical protein PSX81_10205 [bacterium]|nr:hypothetical protein [bacterium]